MLPIFCIKPANINYKEIWLIFPSEEALSVGCAEVSSVCVYGVVAECFVDLNFVVDSSGSVNYRNPNNWNLMLSFVANLTQQFPVGPKDVQVSFVRFGDYANVEWGLTRYHDKATLLKAIVNVVYLDARTNLNRALFLTWSQIYAPGNGTRPGADMVSVILTDGQDNMPTKLSPLMPTNATACKNMGIRLIAVGVTDSVDRERLLSIVSSPFDYYAVAAFDDLGHIVNQMKPTICDITAATVPSQDFSLCTSTQNRIQ